MISLSSFLAEFGYRPEAVLHVGANTGAEVGEYVALGIKRGLLIEPVSHTFQLLKERLADLDGFVPVKALVAEEDGRETTIRITSNSGESSSILSLASHELSFPQITVVAEEVMPTITIDTLLSTMPDAAFDLWVIDVEGAEMLVLQGASAALQHARVIMIEIHDEETHVGCPHFDTIKDELAKSGFAMKEMSIGRYGFGDALFLHKSVGREGDDPFAGRQLINVAPGKQCRQSSLSQWSDENGANGAVILSGRDFGFHTALEQDPWWMIDLGEVLKVDLIRIGNRDGARERAFKLFVEVSDDEHSWVNIHENNGWYFGALGDRPLCIRPGKEHFRYLRIGLRGKQYLHLQSVEIFVQAPAAA
jgi:FkbM family methyltransferase